MTTARHPPVRLGDLPVDDKTVAMMAHRAHRRRKAGYTDVAVPIIYLEKLLQIAAKAVKDEN